MTTSLILNNIIQEYPTPDGKVNRVIDDVSLNFDKPGINMLLGPSGCGKSTLLRMMGGVRPPKVVTPTSGTIAINGLECTDASEDAIMVFQRYSNRPDLTVRQNIEFPFSLKLWKRRVNRVDATKRIDEMINAVGLSDKQNLYPFQLSGGQNQRVALAQALALKPQILLMDEPFGALDAQIRRDMQNLLVNLYNMQPCVIVFVTHDVQEALILGDRITVLSTQPARLADQMWLTQPRPRRDDWLRSSETLALETRILKTLGHGK